jgi:hypothetical protein
MGRLAFATLALQKDNDLRAQCVSLLYQQTPRPSLSPGSCAGSAHVQSQSHVLVLYLAVAVIRVVKRSLRALEGSQTADITKHRQYRGEPRMPGRLIHEKLTTM